MRIAYLLLAHRDIPFIKRVSEKLTAETRNECFIHFDAKSNEKVEISAGSNRIHWLEERYPVYWGGYSVILATLALFKEAVSKGFDRYMIFHGADYPLYNNHYINHFFEDHNEVEFINAIDESNGNKREWFRYIPKNYLDKPNLIKRIHNRMNVEYFRSSLPKLCRTCGVTYGGTHHHIYRGWGHFAVTHELARYILDFSNRYPEYNDFFKHVYAPDESYFHTIVYNSEWVKKTQNGGPIPEKERCLKNLLNLTYFEYPSSVRIFKYKEEYELLKKTGYLFFRKVGSESKELLDYIDQVSEDR